MLAANKSSFLMVAIAAVCILANVDQSDFAPTKIGPSLNDFAPAKAGVENAIVRPIENKRSENRPDNYFHIFFCRPAVAFLRVEVFRWQDGDNGEVVRVLDSQKQSIIAFHNETWKDGIQIFFVEKNKKIKKLENSYWVSREIFNTLCQYFDIIHRW